MKLNYNYFTNSVMKSEFITIQGYDTLPTEDASIKDGFPIKKQMTQNCKTSPQKKLRKLLRL